MPAADLTCVHDTAVLLRYHLQHSGSISPRSFWAWSTPGLVAMLYRESKELFEATKSLT